MLIYILNYKDLKLCKKCIIQNENWLKKYTGIFAMSSSKIVNYEMYKQGGINGERLLKFLQRLLKDKKNKIIILDNASSHKNKKVKKFITKNNFLLFTVPYPHRTQAIEGFFNGVKK